MVTTSNLNPLIRETTTYISSAAMNLLNLDPILNDVQVPHNQHNQITFEVPSQHDLLHIENLHKHQQSQQQHQHQQQQSTNLNNLLERFGNVAYEAFAPKSVSVTSASGSGSGSEVSSISNEQIAKSVVLNLHDLKGQSGTQTENMNVNVNGDLDWLERLFADADMHMIINYLWIGVVCALIILSLVFIMFSVYFYRKFRLWKQCNKDIRAQLSANGNLSNNNNMHINNNNNNGTTCESAYYQMMTQQQCAAPPPCYTIATGLPTYAEALNRQQPHYALGMRFLYPSMTTKTAAPATTTTTTTCIDTMTTKMQQQEKLLPNNEASIEATTIMPPSYTEALKLAFTLNVNQQQQLQQQKSNENVVDLGGSSTTGDFVIDMA